MKTLRTHTYKAKLSKATHLHLDHFLEPQWQLYNAALQERSEAYKKCGVSIVYSDQQKSLTEIRKDREYGQYHCHSQRTVLRRLDQSFKRFFARVKNGEKPGHPRFKGKIEGIPKVLRIVNPSLRVKVQLVCEIEQEVKKDHRPPVGIDVGIQSRITLSNGYQEPKNIIDRSELKRKQRILANAVKGSNHRKKKRKALSKEHQRVAQRERGILHETTSKLVTNQTSRFFVEDLKIQNMVRNHNLARSIYEQQWGPSWTC